MCKIKTRMSKSKGSESLKFTCFTVKLYQLIFTELLYNQY